MATQVVKLLKPDSGGHMQRIFSEYAWRSGTIEILGFARVPEMVRDLGQFTPGSSAAALNYDDLFLVRCFCNRVQ